MIRYDRKLKIFSALEVANICGVVNQTAINWIRSGYLKAFTTPGGQYRVYSKDLAAFLHKRGMADSSVALNNFLEKPDWNLILIATGKTEIKDLIKNTIKMNFPAKEILSALNGYELGRLLAEIKPGVILFDLTLEGVNHTRLINGIKDDYIQKPYVYLINPPASSDALSISDGLFNLPEQEERFLECIRSIDKQSSSA